jgi:DNA-binding LacI/PurR family transcriptional regulator
MAKRTRLKDIAHELGLSANTVSLALKGSSRINEKTRMKVLQKARELQYIPNTLARSLVQKKTNTIGIVLPRMTNPIFLETAQRIESVLIAKGYSLILMTADRNPKYEASALDVLLSREVDGIFLYPIRLNNRDKIKFIRETNCPIILLSGGEYDLPSDAVYMNRKMGAYKATSHLASLGHREIAFICGGFANDEEKLQGYKKALEDYGCPYDPEIVIPVQEFTYEQGYVAASLLFQKRRPSAIFAAGDYLALGALRWCRNNGLRVPEDVAIVGYDDLEAAKYAEVPLTSVTYNFEEITKQSTDLLFSLIAEGRGLSATAPRKISIEPELMIRESCGYRKK